MQKYVVLRGTDFQGRKALAPIIFPQVLIHADIARVARIGAGLLGSVETVSAGFLVIGSTETVLASGRSDSLDIESHSMDGSLLAAFLFADLPSYELFNEFGKHYG